MRATPTQLHRPDGHAIVEMVEWDRVDATSDPRLAEYCLRDNPILKQVAETLRGRVEIRDGLDGLEVASNSFVGRIDVGPLRIVIKPKLPALPLANLVRYAYCLRDLGRTGDTEAPATRHGLHDLLVSLLAEEVEELVYRGVARRYIPQQQSLQSPRGHIDCRELVRLGGIREARLPCLFFDRSKDWHLNQIVNAGLYFGARLTEDPYLRGRVQLLSEMLHDVSRVERLSENDVDLAEAKLSRLTEAYRPALTLIRLLCGMLGLGFDASQRSADTPGYLFDMNIFFQRLVSRFLRENLTDSRIKDQMQVRSLFTYVPDANPRMRSAPALRPDYAYFRGPDLIGFLDAKYRDIWQSSLPTEWLYQLSVYALASPSYTGILLYPSMAHEARDERIEIRQPITRSHRGPACVVVRPVSMNRLSELVHPTQKFIFDRERRLYARRMVN